MKYFVYLGFKLYSLLKQRVLLTEARDPMTQDCLLLAYKQSPGAYGPGPMQAWGPGAPSVTFAHTE